MVNVLLLAQRVHCDQFAAVLNQNRNFRVVEANTTLEARRILSAFPNGFDLAIIDIYTPSVHGIEFLNDLRQYSTDAAILVLADDEARVVEAIGYGIAGYLMRPFTVNQFTKTIRTALKSNYHAAALANNGQPSAPQVHIA
jgi:response regulator of citrate/malate metabolism